MPRNTNATTAPRRKKKPLAAAAQEVASVMEETNQAIPETGLEDEIRLRAYEIYLQRVGSPGDEYQDWLSAEREVLARHQHERRA